MNRRVVPALSSAVAVLILIGGHAQGQLSGVGSYTEDARSARLSTLQEKFKINLSPKERELVVERCGIAQSNLKKIADKLAPTKAARATSYNEVLAELSSLRILIASKGVDTSSVDLLLVNYQQAINQFNAAVDDYELRLDDVLVVDCVSDPESFRAALEGVRESRKNVVSASSSIQEITKSDLKTTLDTLKSKLEVGGAE